MRSPTQRLTVALVLTLAAMATAQTTQPSKAGSGGGTAPKEDDRPVVADTPAPAKDLNPALPSLFLVGDSTLKSDPPPIRGWAQEIAPYFDTSKINVVNRAIGGRSSRTFLHEGRWEKVLADVKPGDFVIVQFGHNDAGRHDDPAAKGRPSLKGEGDETAQAPNSRGEMETIHSFGWYMRNYATTAKAKGATVILASMVPHKSWKDGKISRGNQLVKWTENAAKATGSPYINLNELVAARYDELGPDKVNAFFHDARTHTNVEGAKFTANVVIDALKQLPGNPLGAYFK